MTTHEINPDSTVLRQLDQQWEKIAALLVWKLARDGVQLKAADFERFTNETNAGEAVLFTRGSKDAIELSIVTAERARVLAEHDAAQSGRA